MASTQRRFDVVALGILAVVTLFGARDIFLDPVRMGLDSLTFFWPIYAHLGEQLRQGNLPGWNPYQFSGVPFLADAESGWMYAPAMIVFSILPLAAAVKVYATFHLLLVGFTTYAYARIIGLVPLGALTAALAISQNGFYSDRARCCYAHIQVASWIPLALIGIELAVRAARHRGRWLAWLVTAFAISQMYAGWIGQGVMYALMLIGAYVAWRTLLSPRPDRSAPRDRLVDALQHGLIPLAVGTGLAVPGILPRARYYGETNLADGYTGSASWAAEVGGWTFGRQLELFLLPSGWYIGATVIALGLIAVVLSPRSLMTPFFATLTVVGFTLGLERHTPLHQVLFTLLPPFEELHSHFPERVALILIFGPAMLAGIGAHALVTRPRPGPLGVAALGFVVLGSGMRLGDLYVQAQSWRMIVIAGFLLAVLAALDAWNRAHLLRIGTVALVALVVVELQLAAATSYRQGDFLRTESSSIQEPNQTAQVVLGDDAPYPPRYFGYDPSLQFLNGEEITYYRHNYKDPMTFQLLVNNQGTIWQISDIQGYNPLQLQRYVDFITWLNGEPQEYHGAYVLEGGLQSSLLGLLAVDFVVIPLEIPADRPDLQDLVLRYPEVARTDFVRVLEVTDALPRAWVVGDVVTVEPEMLESTLTSGSIDFATTGVVANTNDPDLRAGGSGGSATITSWSPDRIALEASSSGPGLLVVSETYAEGWSATVDGELVEVIAVDGVLRGVPLAGGDHRVVMTYTPPGLRDGIAAGLGTIVVALAGIYVTGRLDRRRTVSPAETPLERPGSAAAGPPA